MHRTVLAALLAVALLPATADAEKPRRKPYWPLCVDKESNDVRLFRNGPPVEARHLDMLSADVFGRRGETIVTIRLVDLREPAEGFWYATWRVGRTTYWAEVGRDSLSGESVRAGVTGGAAIAATGGVDFAKNHVSIRLARGMTGRVASVAFTTRRGGDVENPVVVDDLACSY